MIKHLFKGKQKAELVSIHIPKTGGRSFYKILKLIYNSNLDTRTKREEYFPEDNENSLIRLTKGFSVIHGHFYFQEVRHLLNRNTKIITWLRDPVDRVISNYYFLMHRIQTGRVKTAQLDKAGYSLMDYARIESQRNVMNRFLGGSNLDDYFFVGDFQDFANETTILMRKLNVQMEIPYIHINKTQELNIYQFCKTRPEEISQSMRKEIKDLNREDYLLFNTMLEIKGKRA